MLVDSHCHLDNEKLHNISIEIIERAKNLGIGSLLTISTSLESIKKNIEIAENFDDVWCSVGIHPHEADKQKLSFNEIHKIAKHKKVIGIGETGLDFFYNYSSVENQETSFRTHLEAANISNLPIIIHNRNSDDLMAKILKDETLNKNISGVIHCFSSSKKLAKTVLDLGFYISISGIITFKKSDEIREIAKFVPMDKLLIETDAPYLAPVPYRGKTNEPSLMIHTAEVISSVKSISLNRLAETTTNNFFKLFSKSIRPKFDPNFILKT
ncbi:TatD family hydrolase [Alphaproteobacteria bacterium]|nr:TatD family hydrolase [Alphaproteobacteria bacterium]